MGLAVADGAAGGFAMGGLEAVDVAKVAVEGFEIEIFGGDRAFADEELFVVFIGYGKGYDIGIGFRD